MTIRSSFRPAPPRRALLLLAALLLLGAPAALLVNACSSHCDDCDIPFDCVAECGAAPVVVVYGVDECPPGTLPDNPIACVAACGGPVVWEGCAWSCPAGTHEDSDVEEFGIDCYAQCDAAPVARVCRWEDCPVGLLSDAECAPCPTEAIACVSACTAPKTAVALCAAHCPAGTLDWRHCLDAGTDPNAGADGG